jgi:hypothetical protein
MLQIANSEQETLLSPLYEIRQKRVEQGEIELFLFPLALRCMHLDTFSQALGLASGSAAQYQHCGRSQQSSQIAD